MVYGKRIVRYWKKISSFLLLLSIILATPVWSIEVVDLKSSDRPSQKDVDFFENKIRPVLVKHCYECHSVQAQSNKNLKGGLLLDSRAAARKGGDSGSAVVPSNPSESLLLSAVKHESFEMPPRGKLPAEIIADLEKWIQIGAPDPREKSSTVEKTSIDIEEGRQFWSIRPLSKVIPTNARSDWPRTTVDQFVWESLQQKKLTPGRDAQLNELVRRLYFDLIGLPPTPGQIQSFIKSATRDRDQTIADLVDNLLASPRFGERWGRHWLDIARYGESNGATKNTLWPHAWRYRDYVIQSFNNDKPYAQFLREQIAGDLLPAESGDQRFSQMIATGFLALGSKANDATRMEIIGEQLDVLGRAMLGISIGCARCHDHKYDPVPTRDFYALAGIMHNTAILDGKPYASLHPNEAKSDAQKFKIFERAIASATRNVEQAEDRLEELAKQQGLRLRPGDSWKSVIQEFQDTGRKKNAVEALQKLEEAKVYLDKILQNGSPETTFSVGVMDRAAKGRNWLNARIQIRGSDSNLGEEIPRGMMQVLYQSGDPLPVIGEQESGRLQLANILSQHPLTARVMVNRIWHHLFGRGLVKTVDNFGTMGERPTHPELLEWLAARFVEEGGSVKKIIRRIVLSRTYQLSAQNNANNLEIDPEAKFIWRHQPRRLDAEVLRDAILSASGSINLIPPTSVEKYAAAIQMTDVTATAKSHHRAVYLPAARGFTTDILDAFNFPQPDLVVGKRETPSVPTQALFMMNSRLVGEQSQFMARRLLNQKTTNEERIREAWMLVLCRQPNSAEIHDAETFLRKFQYESRSNQDFVQQDAWAVLCQSLFASVEFRFLR